MSSKKRKANKAKKPAKLTKKTAVKLIQDNKVKAALAETAMLLDHERRIAALERTGGPRGEKGERGDPGAGFWG